MIFLLPFLKPWQKLSKSNKVGRQATDREPYAYDECCASSIAVNWFDTTNYYTFESLPCNNAPNTCSIKYRFINVIMKSRNCNWGNKEFILVYCHTKQRIIWLHQKIRFWQRCKENFRFCDICPFVLVYSGLVTTNIQADTSSKSLPSSCACFLLTHLKLTHLTFALFSTHNKS